MTKDLVVAVHDHTEIMECAKRVMVDAACHVDDLEAYLKKIMADINTRLQQHEACDISFFKVVLPLVMHILEAVDVPHEDVAQSDVEVRKEWKFGFPPRLERVAYAIRGLVVPDGVQLKDCEGVITSTISVARTPAALEKHERER